eukprot:GGOE01009282.1.p6 GENE.GGOE01009282.1~~GGOE01009282.1.p6  ORF type:complete len:101 (+),score=7.33 GGOE01009282.1:654-956(+)
MCVHRANGSLVAVAVTVVVGGVAGRRLTFDATRQTPSSGIRRNGSHRETNRCTASVAANRTGQQNRNGKQSSRAEKEGEGRHPQAEGKGLPQRQPLMPGR